MIVASPRYKFICQSACMRAVAKKASMHMCMHVVLHAHVCVYMFCMCRLSMQTEYMHRITNLPCLQILPRGSQRSNYYISCYDYACITSTCCSVLLFASSKDYHLIYPLWRNFSAPKASVFSRKDDELVSKINFKIPVGV